MNTRTRHHFVVLAAAVALLLACAVPPVALAARSNLSKLRDYYAKKGDRKALRGQLARLSLSRLLGLLRQVEPHVRQTQGIQRFETPDGAYYVIPPRAYSARKAWPLHIALHGHGSTQTGKVACTRYWKGEPARHGFILACPDLRGRWNTTRGEHLVLSTYKDVQQRFNVRTDRVSLGGFSGGGIGSWIFGPRYPDLFSALVPRAGIPPRADEVIQNLNGLPLYLIHGTGDGTIAVKHSRRVAEQLRRLKLNHVYKERTGGHEFFGALNNDVLTWLKKQRRKLRTRFRYHGPIGGAPRIIHWLQLEGSGTVTVRGRILKRRRVVIELDHPERVRKLTVHLGRKIFDMNRRHVDVVINGKAFGFPLRERGTAVLDSYDITRDLRRVFTGSVSVRITRLP